MDFYLRRIRLDDKVLFYRDIYFFVGCTDHQKVVYVCRAKHRCANQKKGVIVRTTLRCLTCCTHSDPYDLAYSFLETEKGISQYFFDPYLLKVGLKLKINCFTPTCLYITDPYLLKVGLKPDIVAI
jgi:hypothetical protein